VQLPDATNHVHTVTITAAEITAGAPMTFTTSPFPAVTGHTHMITLTGPDFTALRAGGSVTKTSTANGMGPHTHMYEIICT
jgi:hypothetical protein